MMNVIEYAQDVNKEVSYILKKCLELGIKVSKETDMLTEDDIVQLDNFISKDVYEESFDEELEDRVEEILEEENIDADNVVVKQKLKKKTDVSNANKRDFANKKKEMYKNKEKLMVNSQVTNNNVVLYKENMTIGELAESLGVSGAEIIKKLFLLGIMTNINSSINFENAEILVLDYNKQLKKERDCRRK